MRMAAALIGASILGAGAGFATTLHDHPTPVPDERTVQTLEDRLRGPHARTPYGDMAEPGGQIGLPALAAPLDRYVRRYALVTLASEEDLPFTTIVSPPSIPAYEAAFRGRRIIGVLTLPSPDIPRAATVERVRLHELPQIFHGGCMVVNVVYDPAADRVVAAWCNYDDAARPPPVPDGATPPASAPARTD